MCVTSSPGHGITVHRAHYLKGENLSLLRFLFFTFHTLLWHTSLCFPFPKLAEQVLVVTASCCLGAITSYITLTITYSLHTLFSLILCSVTRILSCWASIGSHPLLLLGTSTSYTSSLFTLLSLILHCITRILSWLRN
jgi:hypothetical protein